jgi:hypothetical protein
MGIRHSDHMTPLHQQKLALTSLTSGGCLVSIVGSQTVCNVFIYLMVFNDKSELQLHLVVERWKCRGGKCSFTE